MVMDEAFGVIGWDWWPVGSWVVVVAMHRGRFSMNLRTVEPSSQDRLSIKFLV